MSDFDVSLRLRLVNQLSRPAEEAERDLKDLQKAAEQLGRGKGGANLAGDLQKVGKEADAAKAKISGITAEANDSKLAIQRIGDGFGGFRADANDARQSVAGITTEAGEARQAIGRIGAEAGEIKGKIDGAEQAIRGIGNAATDAKQAVGRIGDGALDGLKADAQQAEQAIRQIGDAADQQRNKLRALGTGQGPLGHGGPIRPGGGLMSTVEGATDQLGLPIALAAGTAYVTGAATGGALVIGGAAIKGAAADEFASDQLRVLGEYSAEDQARYDRQMAGIGARKGTGTAGAMGVFGRLMSGGLDAESAAASTEAAIVFGKATQASPEDAARTTIALRNTFGIGTDEMMSAYDAMAMGGKAGEFEVPDMAKNFPSIASKMAALGEGGMSGTRLLVALGQAIRKTAGTSDEASTNFENMLGKFRSQDFIKNAGEFGIDAEKTLTSAQEEGRSPVMALLEEIQAKVGNDGFKLAKLMPDVQSLAGLEASLNGLKEVKSLMADMEAAPGTVMNDFATATDNASSAFDRFTANVAARAKELASGVLPPLTAAMNAMSDAMERASEKAEAREKIETESRRLAQETIERTGNVNEGIAAAYRHQQEEQQELDWRDPETQRRRMIEAYQQYGQSRLEGERGAPSAWQKFWFGAGANSGFDVKDHFAIRRGQQPDIDPAIAASTASIPIPTPRPAEFGQAASEGMGAYNEALQAEGQKAEAEAQSIADKIKSWLGFTVSPTISPTYIPPAGAPPAPSGPGPQTSTQSSINNSTYNVTSPNPQHAALRTRRAQEREIRRAQAGSFHDTGRRLA